MMTTAPAKGLEFEALWALKPGAAAPVPVESATARRVSLVSAIRNAEVLHALRLRLLLAAASNSRRRNACNTSAFRIADTSDTRRAVALSTGTGAAAPGLSAHRASNSSPFAGAVVIMRGAATRSARRQRDPRGARSAPRRGTPRPTVFRRSRRRRDQAHRQRAARRYAIAVQSSRL